MQNPLKRYLALARRWLWLLALGIVLCGGAGYVVSKSMKPVYQASAFIVVNLSTTTAPYDVNGSVAIAPTYAQLITNPGVLDPVVEKHPGMTLAQLRGMISVTPQTNGQTIELDVRNTDPELAALLANQISLSLEQFAGTRLAGGIQTVPADIPTSPVGPKASLSAGIGALIGLALAVALIVLFEWFDDRLRDPEEAQELLGLDTFTILPRLPEKQMEMSAEGIPALAEECRILSAGINAAQGAKPFKLVMVASALPREGRTTLAANLAVSLANAGKRVLLVDADLRHPSLHEPFKLDRYHGLTGILLNLWENDDAVLAGQATAIKTLRVLPAGFVPAKPSELLQQPQTRKTFELLKESQFDYVIVDSPPLLPVADAQVLASYVDVVLLVIDAEKTPRKVLVRARKTLHRAHANILGIVINKSRWSEDSTIRDYLRRAALRESKVGVKQAPVMTAPPNTPPLNGLANHNDPNENGDVTLTLARPIKFQRMDEEK